MKVQIERSNFSFWPDNCQVLSQGTNDVCPRTVGFLHLSWLARSMNELSGNGLEVLRKDVEFRASAEEHRKDEWAKDS